MAVWLGDLPSLLMAIFFYFSFVHIVVGGKVQKIPASSPSGVSRTLSQVT